MGRGGGCEGEGASLAKCGSPVVQYHMFIHYFIA